MVFSDGGARGNPGPAASSFVVFLDGKIVYKDSKFLGRATNNVAEYSAVVMALEWLGKNCKDSSVTFCLDSELVVRQLMGIYKIKDKKLIEQVMRIKNLQKKFNLGIKWVHVRRSQNKIADNLVNEKLDISSRL